MIIVKNIFLIMLVTGFVFAQAPSFSVVVENCVKKADNKESKDPLHDALDCIRTYTRGKQTSHEQFFYYLQHKYETEKALHAKWAYAQAIASLQCDAAITSSMQTLDSSKDQMERELIISSIMFNKQLEPLQLLKYLNDSNIDIGKLVATYYYQNKTDDTAIRDEMTRIFTSKDPQLLASAISYYRALRIEISIADIIKILQENDTLAVLSTILNYADSMKLCNQTLIDAVKEKRASIKDPKTTAELDFYLNAFQKQIARE